MVLVPLAELNIGWLAGLFEGEGSAVLKGPGGLCVAIAMTDKDVIERLQVIFPGRTGIHRRKKRAPTHKTSWEWRLTSKEEAAEFLTLVLPHLGKRRTEQAQKVLLLAHTPPKHGWRDKTHCPHGHRWEEANTHITPVGSRQCRICQRTHQKARRHAARTAARVDA